MIDFPWGVGLLGWAAILLLFLIVWLIVKMLIE